MGPGEAVGCLGVKGACVLGVVGGSWENGPAEFAGLCTSVKEWDWVTGTEMMANTLGTRDWLYIVTTVLGERRGRSLDREKDAFKEDYLGEEITQKALKTMFSFLDGDLGEPFRVQSLGALPDALCSHDKEMIRER